MTLFDVTQLSLQPHERPQNTKHVAELEFGIKKNKRSGEEEEEEAPMLSKGVLFVEKMYDPRSLATPSAPPTLSK